MSDWLVVPSEDNWEVCAREGLLGLGRDADRRLIPMADRDRVWVYVNRKHVDHQVPHVYKVRAVAGERLPSDMTLADLSAVRSCWQRW